MNENQLPAEYKPISMWGYVGYQLLFAIPCIGVICIIIFAFGGTPNINLRNFARSYLLIWLLAIALVVFFFIMMAMLGVAILNT